MRNCYRIPIGSSSLRDLAWGLYLLLNIESCVSLREGTTPVMCLLSAPSYYARGGQVGLDVARQLARPAPASITAVRSAGIDKWQQGQVTGTLDRQGDRALVLRACATAAARLDLAQIAYETSQQLDILVVNVANSISGERVHPAPGEAATSTATPRSAGTSRSPVTKVSGHRSVLLYQSRKSPRRARLPDRHRRQYR
jgi:hypothetical protein